jgi:hypothetical protein
VTRRRIRRGGTGLFAFTADGDIEPGEVRDNPLTRKCPTCHADVADHCTRPGRGGRVPIHGYHDARRLPEGETDA